MRLRRLILQRYGHLADVTLTFPPEAGLQVVVGANEAGKSTALAAIGDCLFGFPHRSDFDFLYKGNELRVGIELAARSGGTATFFRRKGLRDTLRDGQDRPVSDDALLPFLGTASRDLFKHMFGLDAATLREGGQEILRGGGDVGQSLFQASSGLPGLPEVMRWLEAETGKLYGDRRGQRELYAALDAYKAAKVEVDARTVWPSDYKQKLTERDRLSRQMEADATRMAALRAERRKAERIRRTRPALTALADATAEMAALGAVPALPVEAEAGRQAAVLARQTAARDAEREGAALVALREERTALVIDTALLGQAPAIEALARDSARVEAAEADRVGQAARAERERQEIERAATALGLALPAAQVLARAPSDPARAAVRRLITAHAAGEARLRQAEEQRAKAAEQHERAQAALAAAARPEPPARLRKAIETVKAEGKLDEACRRAEAERLAAAAKLARALAALPLWSGTAAELASRKLPQPVTVAEQGRLQQQAETRLRDANVALAAVQADEADETARLAQLERGEAMPTREAIAELRGRRDRAWRLLRRQFVEGGPAPSAAEAEGLAAGPLPDTFEALLVAADTLADRRADEAQRLEGYLQARARLADLQRKREAAAAALVAAQASLDDWQAAWRALWQPAGIVPEAPAAMAQWRAQRDEVVRLLEDDERKGEAVRIQRERLAASRQTLAALVPALAVAAAEGVAGLLQAAEQECERQEGAAQEHRALVRQGAERQDTLAERERAAAEARTGQAAWLAAWTTSVAALGLGAEAHPVEAEAALGGWEQIGAAAARWREALERVADMTRDIDRFAAEAAATVAAVAPDLAGQDVYRAVAALAARLNAARTAERRARDIDREIERHGKAEAAARAAHAEAEGRLAGLRTLAHAATDEELEAAIARAARRRLLQAEQQRRQEELHTHGEGLAIAELSAEAEGVDPDAMAARVEAIDAELGQLGDATLAMTRVLTTLENELAGMERGHDAASSAQAMQTALADMRDIAARYARLRVAGVLLKAGIERFRRQQEGPLLRRASAHFAALTNGRYARLATDTDEQGRVLLLACRPDGAECRAEALSEGTRDQLYLALRVAAIEDHAERAEPLPFIADDLLVNFDDARAGAALALLATFGRGTQTILFTHHEHIAAMAEARAASGIVVQRLG
jgi:uncharacterized protein YhaN